MLNNYHNYMLKTQDNNKSQWYKTLSQVIYHILTYKYLPSSYSNLGYWLDEQFNNYNPNISQCNGIMKDYEIKVTWEKIINDPKYKIYFNNPSKECFNGTNKEYAYKLFTPSPFLSNDMTSKLPNELSTTIKECFLNNIQEYCDKLITKHIVVATYPIEQKIKNEIHRYKQSVYSVDTNSINKLYAKHQECKSKLINNLNSYLNLNQPINCYIHVLKSNDREVAVLGIQFDQHEPDFIVIYADKNEMNDLIINNITEMIKEKQNESIVKIYTQNTYILTPEFINNKNFVITKNKFDKYKHLYPDHKVMCNPDAYTLFELADGCKVQYESC